MKTFNFVCAGFALSGLIVSATLWRDLHAQRELMADWQRAHPEVALANPAQSRPSVPVSGATLPAKTEAEGAAAFAHPATAGFVEHLAGERERLRDPEYRRSALSALRSRTPKDYPGLAESLGLSASEAGPLFDLLAERELELGSLPPLSEIHGEPRDPALVREMVRERQEVQRRQDESLASYLGEARYGKWQDYQETRRAREQVMRQYGTAMTAQGQSLTQAQEQALSAVLVAEWKRQQQEIQTLRRGAPQQAPVSQAQLMAQTAQRRVESNQRIVVAAQPHLNAAQLESLRTTLDQQVAALRRTGLAHP